MLEQKFLTPEEFWQHYELPPDALSRSKRAGSYGSILITKNQKSIIKIQKFNVNFLKEVCLMNQLNHPNIAKIEAITIIDGMGLIGMKRGFGLQDAYFRDLISVREIISDLVSALKFLRDCSVVHADLKPGNAIVIFKNNRYVAQLIDFGISRMALPYNDGYFYPDIAYTEPFRDPEFDRSGNNPIDTEIYGLASMIWFLRNEPGRVNPFYYNFLSYPFPKDENGHALLEKCQDFLSERNFESILSDPYIIGDRIENGDFSYEGRITNLDQSYYYETNMLIELAILYKCKNCVVFLALEIFRNLLNLTTNPGYFCTPDSIKMCLVLASSFYDFALESSLESEVCSDKKFLPQFALCFEAMFRLTQGKFFSLTQWYTAISCDEFRFQILQMFTNGYDPYFPVYNDAIHTESKKDGIFQTDYFPYGELTGITQSPLSEEEMYILYENREKRPNEEKLDRQVYPIDSNGKSELIDPRLILGRLLPQSFGKGMAFDLNKNFFQPEELLILYPLVSENISAAKTHLNIIFPMFDALRKIIRGRKEILAFRETANPELNSVLDGQFGKGFLCLYRIVLLTCTLTNDYTLIHKLFGLSVTEFIEQINGDY